jgi:hypothetical protein
MSDFNDTDCDSTSIELYRTDGPKGLYINYDICNYNGIKIVKEDDKSLLNTRIMFIFQQMIL